MHNVNQNIDLNTLRFLFERYKDYLFPFVVILASIFLFIRVVLPSFFGMFEALEKQQTELLTLSNMENKLSLLKGIDESTLDSHLKVVSKALPIDKDFEGLLNAISDASGKSVVSIAGFKFTVGKLSGEDEQVGVENPFPTLDIELNINGTPAEANDFIGKLNKTLPLSQINVISINEELSNIKINFYYKRLTRSSPDDSLPLSAVSDSGLSLINKLSSSFSIPASLELTSTLSAVINPNPFE